MLSGSEEVTDPEIPLHQNIEYANVDCLDSVAFVVDLAQPLMLHPQCLPEIALKLRSAREGVESVVEEGLQVVHTGILRIIRAIELVYEEEEHAEVDQLVVGQGEALKPHAAIDLIDEELVALLVALT